MRNIQRIPDDQLDQFVALFAEAYPGMKIMNPEAQRKITERIQSAQRDPRIEYWGLYEDGKLAGEMRLHDFRMNVRGVMLPAGGLGGVAVDLLRKKEGIAKDLCSFYLQRFFDKGASMALLWPFRPDFYKKMGFGIGSPVYQYRLSPRDLPNRRGKERVCYLDKSDAKELCECYNRLCYKTTGMCEETEIGFVKILDRDPEARVVGYRHNGKIQGYLIFKFTAEGTESFLDNSLQVIECLFETPEALNGLLGFLHTQFDQVDRIVLSVHDDQFYHLPVNPTSDRKHIIPSVHHESHIAGVGIMYRVLNARIFFESMKGKRFGGGSLGIAIKLRDSFVPANQGPLSIMFDKGEARLATEKDCDVEIEMDISDFSSMIMGAATFDRLRFYGLASISDERRIEAVSEIFRTDQKPVCVTGF